MSKNIRRGRSWQQFHWRGMLTPSEELTDRALAAFDRLRRVALRRHPAVPQQRPPHRMIWRARLAPYLGDGIPVGGPFMIRLEYRGFP